MLAAAKIIAKWSGNFQVSQEVHKGHEYKWLHVRPQTNKKYPQVSNCVTPDSVSPARQ